MSFPSLFDDALPKYRCTPYFDMNFGVRTGGLFEIPRNHYVGSIPVAESFDSTLPFNVHLFELDGPLQQQKVKCRGIEVISPVSISYDLDEGFFDSAYARLKNLDGDLFELWHRDYPLHTKTNFPDPWGEATAIIEYLTSQLDITSPPFNHNKISSKKHDKFECNELHLDSFEGMRVNERGQRQFVYRYFLNLGNDPRDTVVAINDIDFTANRVAIDNNPKYLDAILRETQCQLPMLKLNTQPRDPKTRTIHGYKVLTTHLVHGEYGTANDFFAAINSLE